MAKRRIFENREGKIYTLSVKELKPGQMKAMSSHLAGQILNLLSKRQLYPLAIAKKLKVNEQKVYYHIKNLEQSGLIQRTEQKIDKGVIINYFSLAEKAFFVKFHDFEETKKNSLLFRTPSFLIPFIEKGKISSNIIIGSPDPHGPSKARSRDGMYAVDLALFLGSYLYHQPYSIVKRDIDITKEDLKNNLIIIGGPKVNKITSKLNLKLPAIFDPKKGWSIVSKKTGKIYGGDDCGIIVKMKNPFCKTKKILVLAGKKFSGTKAAILALIEKCEEWPSARKGETIAKIVEGLDLDFDGNIDSFEVLE